MYYINTVFSNIDEAVEYAKKNDITLSNDAEELEEWKQLDELTKQNNELARYDHFYLGTNSVTWCYFNPDGCNGKGELVETTIPESIMIMAYDEYADHIKKGGMPETAGGKFMETLYTYCQTMICENDGSPENTSIIEIFRNDKPDLAIDGTSVSQSRFGEILIDFLKEHNETFQKHINFRSFDGYRPVKTDTAVTMWENGFEIKAADGHILPSFESIGDSGYDLFENTEDMRIYAKKSDYEKQQLFDVISETAEKLEEYGYNFGENGGNEMKGYSDMQTVTQNIQRGLSEKEYTSVSDFFQKVYKNEGCTGEIAQQEASALKSVRELENMEKNENVQQRTVSAGTGRK